MSRWAISVQDSAATSFARAFSSFVISVVAEPGDQRDGVRLREFRLFLALFQPTEQVHNTVLSPASRRTAYPSLARRCLAGTANSSTNATSSARAMASSISSVGFALPFSIRLIAACSTLVSAARSSWVQPRAFLSRRMFAASVFATAEFRAGNLSPNPDRAIAARSVSLMNPVDVIYHIFERLQ
jgi:hypothetical protein